MVLANRVINPKLSRLVWGKLTISEINILLYPLKIAIESTALFDPSRT